MPDTERDNLIEKIEMLIGLHRKHDEKLTSIDDLLRGNYERPGMINRVTNLENAEAERKVWYRLTVGAAITSSIGAVVAWVKSGGAG